MTAGAPGADAPVGIFDSGVGGLSVLRSIRALLPEEDLVYLGDTARVPYGSKSPETVRTYCLNITEHLLALGCKAVVIACNTASAFAHGAVEAFAGVPVVDVIRPVAADVARSGHRRVLVLGTRGTVSSGAYVEALHQHDAGVVVAQQACPLFVPLAEEGWLSGDVPRLVTETYLREPLATHTPEALILGCTHYPVLRASIEQVLQSYATGPVSVYDSGPATAKQLRGELERAGLRRERSTAGAVRYLVTDTPETFSPLASRFLGEPVARAEHVDITRGPRIGRSG